ncbi:endonuclease domain-containing 1 protein-like isoform X1 [Tachysurus fulvidraco]|uniref:endonuclease domain-containing 1 protein-like isoform X1 n=1 Tax=Tachysurus fulvidraco TaxID=1234273 RepID=UPI001FF00A24|nr:endonuclease domain-containing 1 protein-like isoform X1 [Tachysurus fulvidraco]XP_047669366.1 endonuclease domain-containing 1 protein-like isoform X1 [Tachysurus fulvidraco]XP_047669367.1 endonuclease domain-containing 1 protein-like isoform X1 [Tachysurus fulvidraco]XP_047669368.1 endonuclease domain-containing 1 protein-like isoform X1 [Tachysurus fulvidraco]
MKLLALVLLLSTFSSLTLMEVVMDFKNYCSEFFIQIITPTVFKGYQYKQICQRLNNLYTFATLYDMKNRIPVYSAYTFSGGDERDRKGVWKNEPQLENIPQREMREITNDEVDEFFHQAVNRDYKESGKYTKINYTRGHVFPYQYAADQNQADSTFTFTNIAPQTQHSNGEWANKVETPMKAEIQRVCSQENRIFAFIVTGVVPGNNWITIRRSAKKKKKYQQGVNIPSFYWTAFCCYINQTTIISKAYLAQQNEPNPRPPEITSVNILNRRLSSLYNQDFKVFGDMCLT